MLLAERPLNRLLEDFRSSAPTPGGGSASALAGAVGASLLAMVASLPKPQASTPADVDALENAGDKAGALAKTLERLIDRDSDAYDLVVGAYRLPKASDEEKALRSARIQEALKAAIAAPLDVMRACADGLALAPTLARLGNQNAASDVKVGVELLGAGLRGARLNVEINLGSVKDAAYTASVTQEVERLFLSLSGSGAADAPSASS